VMHAWAAWPGSQAVPHDVFIGQVLAVAQTATAHGGRLLVLNGHDENHEPLVLAARTLNAQGCDVIVVEWAQLVSDVIASVCTSTSESHAGEGLTSVFLHWYPERVRPERVAVGASPPGGLAADDLHVVRRAHHVRTYSRTDAPTGVLGDPTLATAEKGEAIGAALVSRLALLVGERGWV
jgi:creatinine amidohydrolase/Fe(II)-dependent formamide hydrolase-like protein